MTLADQRAQLERRRDALVALWAEKKINLVEFASGIEVLRISLHMLNTSINAINTNCTVREVEALNLLESEDDH